MSAEESQCEHPCDPNNACEECAPYWQDMEAQGYWDRAKHQWTDKGFRRILEI